MRVWLKHLNFYTHTQVFLRVMPVVFVTVLAVGAFSWIVFATNITENAANHQSQELTAFIGNLRHRASLEAMTLEYWKEEGWAGSLPGVGQPGEEAIPATENWVEPLTRFDLVGAAAMVSYAEASSKLSVVYSFADSFDNVANRRTMDSWIVNHRSLLGENCDLEEWAQSGPGNHPVLTETDFFHSIYLLSPILVQVADAGSSRSGRASRHALLPVLVRENASGDRSRLDPPDNRIDAPISGWRESTTHGVFFLDLAALVNELPLNDWWCVLGEGGRVMGSRSGLPYAGIRLKDQPEMDAVGIFGAMSGGELASWMNGSWIGMDHRLVGWRKLPWLVTGARAQDLPMTILTARPAGHIRAMTLRYAWAILAVALIALLGAFVGIAKVLGPFSHRLNAVSRNMESLAAGDYSIRMNTGPANEVERLVGYFNTMAGSLDETNRQLGEKTEHLEAALSHLMELDKAKDEFLVLISHEVRTPLTAIMGGIDFLKSTVARSDEALRAALERLNVAEITEIMDHSACRLRDFMNDAIQMISIQNSERKLILQPVSAHDFIAACLESIGGKAAERGLILENRLPDVPNWNLLCDVEVLRVALNRVLDNAVVHNEEDGLIRVAEAEGIPGRGPAAMLADPEGILRLAGHLPDGRLIDTEINWRLLEIFNTGAAIPADRQEALFTKFQVVGEIEHHQKGSGLSLPIALAALEHHGGDIFLHSVEGQGNSFYLLVPTVPAPLADSFWTSPGSGDQQAQRVGGAAGNEQIGQVADSAALEIEFHDVCSGSAGDLHESGCGIDGAGSAYDEEKITISGGLR
jgi:signal transduction histidine kinase